MLTWLRDLVAPKPAPESEAPDERRRVVEVGWQLGTEKATFIYEAPRPSSRKAPLPAHAKAVGFCPAMIDHEARLFEVLCPVDLSIRIGRNKEGKVGLINAAGQQSNVSGHKWREMIHLLPSSAWSAPNLPLLRIAAPWRFLADEPVWMLQMPPFNHYRRPPWPGLVIGRRVPIHIWPCSLSWLFEWHDPKQTIELKRGEPWFYLRFESEDPSRPVRLVEAESTPELRDYCSGIDATGSFVRDERELFAAAAARRPNTLLVKKQRG